jgi:hypothetical protein
MVLASWLSANSWKFRNSFRLYQLGVLSDADWQSELLLITGYYGTPWGIQYFESAKVFWDRKYVALVEQALAERQSMGSDYIRALTQ